MARQELSTTGVVEHEHVKATPFAEPQGRATNPLRRLAIVAKTFAGLDQIVAARRYLEPNEQIGKIVVTI